MTNQQMKRQFAQQQGAAAPDLPYGKDFGPKKARKRLMQLNFQNAFDAQGPLWAQIGNLQQQANTNRFTDEGRANFLAPRLEAIDRFEDQAGAQLTRDLAARGIEDSSGGVNALTGLAARTAEARAGAVNQLYQTEEARQLQAQALLRDLLMNLQGRNSQQALAAANAITDYQMQQQQLDAMNNWMTPLMGLAGQLGGSYLGRPTG